MQYSQFGQKYAGCSGITLLMDDLNEGMRNPDAIMMGGGNPAGIAEMEDYLRNACASLLDDGSLIQAIGNYDGPQGQSAFIRSLAAMLQRQYGWEVGPRNITLTNGSQSSFFYLFNILAGGRQDGSRKKILLPLSPEYIGYSDVGIDPGLFTCCAPKIELLGERLFKYHIHFDKLPVNKSGSDSIAAICASRPTNPTGNVLTDLEIARLDELAHSQQIPLILDSAYGPPFPNIIFNEVQPFWNANTILCMSLSKLGLPGLRCGIVIACEAITRVLTNMNGIISLAPGSLGPTLGHYMIQHGDLLKLSREVVQPFYLKKSRQALALVRELIVDERVLIHKPEGAMFLWLWLRDLPIPTMELYRRLKDRGVLIVPGEFFFPGSHEDESGTASDARLRHQCLRMNYVQNHEMLRRGIEIIAEESKKAYRGE